MLRGPAYIVRLALSLTAAAGILVHPSYASARLAKARPAPARRPPIDQKNSKHSKHSAPAPQPATPVAVLSSDTAFSKPGSHAKTSPDLAACNDSAAALAAFAALPGHDHLLPEAPLGRLHRPAHFAHAPPAA